MCTANQTTMYTANGSNNGHQCKQIKCKQINKYYTNKIKRQSNGGHITMDTACSHQSHWTNTNADARAVQHPFHH